MTYKTGSNYKSTTTLIVKKVTEVVNNSTTIQSDDEFTKTLQPGTYVFNAFLLLAGAAASDFKMTFSFGGTSTSAGYNTMASQYLTIALDSNVNQVTATWPNALAVHGYLVVTVAGTFELKWAQNTAVVENTSVLKGSYLEIRKSA